MKKYGYAWWQWIGLVLGALVTIGGVS